MAEVCRYHGHELASQAVALLQSAGWDIARAREASVSDQTHPVNMFLRVFGGLKIGSLLLYEERDTILDRDYFALSSCQVQSELSMAGEYDSATSLLIDRNGVVFTDYQCQFKYASASIPAFINSLPARFFSRAAFLAAAKDRIQMADSCQESQVSPVNFDANRLESPGSTDCGYSETRLHLIGEFQQCTEADFAFLLHSLSHPSDNIRWKAAAAVGNLFATVKHRVPPQFDSFEGDLSPALASRLRDDPERDVRRFSCFALCNMGTRAISAIDPLGVIANTCLDPEIQIAALTSMAHVLGGDFAVKWLDSQFSTHQRLEVVQANRFLRDCFAKTPASRG